jgi:citrate lyase synthetase
MAYEIFDRKRQYGGTAAITITKYGQLSFNKAASEILKKAAIEMVLMLWDKEKRSVGIRGISKKDPRAFTVHWSKRGDGAGFSVTSFLKHIEYNASESRMFLVQWDDEQQMFEFGINKDCFIEGGYVTSMKRKKK